MTTPVSIAAERVPERRSRLMAAHAGSLWPALVAAGFIVAQLVLVVPGTGLGWDETVYVSQYGIQGPPAFFSAPRARGVSYLTAPVAALTSSTLILRVYLALLSGSVLFAALRIWRHLYPARVLALAGGLFAGLWITLFYGPQAMPNLWVALAALVAVGCVLRCIRGPGGRMRWAAGAATAVAGAALMRPLDGFWLTLPLAAGVLAMRGRRRPVVAAVLLAGLLLGCAPWIVEAYAHYGGVLERLRLGSDVEGGLGWHWAVMDQLRSLDGRTLCRPCSGPLEHRSTALWWPTMPVLAAGGVVAAGRTGRRSTALLTVVVAFSLAFPYLFMVDYAAPRFLLPAYALVALPLADFLWWLPTALRPAWRPVAYTAIVLALAAHLLVQQVVLAHTVSRFRAEGRQWAQVATDLNRMRVRAPCIVTGLAVPIAYAAGCASRLTDGPDTSITPAALLTAARAEPVALVVTGTGRLPAWAQNWHPVRLEDVSPAGYRVYLPPNAAAAR
jgi:hypothetical protein